MDSVAELSASTMDSRLGGSTPFGLEQLHVALIHDWLITLGGADRVLLALHDVFPQAPVFVALHALGGLPESFRRLDVRGTWLQRLPGAPRRHRWLVPLMPFAFANLNLRGYDVIVSSSHACAKGVTVPDGAIHVCYCHTPMRYAWDLPQEYLDATPAIMQPAVRAALAWLRQWDRATSHRVDHFIANSHFVAGRIRQHYGRAATVIYPPIDTDFFTPAEDSALPPARLSGHSSGNAPGERDFYLCVSRLVGYKRVGLAVEAFNRLGSPLVVVGGGPERPRLEAVARGNVRIVGEVSDAALRGYYRQCRALVFPGEEDFGMVPVEAQACGRPVIAYARGGVLESVVDGVTGVFFKEQTPEALAAALQKAEDVRWDRATIRRYAERFSHQRFIKEITSFIGAVVRETPAGDPSDARTHAHGR
jgi:glycosyltransferase involved in cell wall biosynthesis